MNRANQQREKSQHCKLWFEAKKRVWKSDKNTSLCDDFSEGKNYNPMEHCEWHKL